MTDNTIFSLMRCISAFIFLSMVSGCNEKTIYIQQSISSSTQAQNIQIGADTYRLVKYHTGHSNVDKPLRTIFYVGGSGCASLSVYLAPYFASLPSGLEVVALEKQGVVPSDLGLSCTNEFWQNYTYDKLIMRNVSALNFVKQQVSGGIFAIIGTSEGGPVALELAASNSDISKVVILAAGGMTQRQELEILAREKGTFASLQKMLKNIDEDPANFDKRTFGFPHPYWSSVLDRDPKQNLSKTSQPVLIIIGEKDANVPVASARVANDLLEQSFLIEWPDADHVFKTPTGNERNNVIKQVGQFLLN